MKINSIFILLSILTGFVASPKPAFANEVSLDTVGDRQILIVETPGSPGSAVVIGKKGDTYLALTAAHVLKDMNSKEEAAVTSLATGKSYTITNIIKLDPKFDVSAIEFSSNENINLSLLDFAGAEHFPCPVDEDEIELKITTDWKACYTQVQAAGVSAPSDAITVPMLRITNYERMKPRVTGNRDGYEFMYEASTVPGMSGGGVFASRQYSSCVHSQALSLLAIHGRSEDYVAGGRSGVSLAVPLILVKDQILAIADKYGIPTKKSQLKAIWEKQYCSQ